MTATLTRDGTNYRLTIDRDMVERSGLRAGAPVEVRSQPGRLIVENPAAEPSIEDLVSRITPDNLHAETDWGPPQGNEAW